MGGLVSVIVRALTDLHDERVSRRDRPEPNILSKVEKLPSVLLVFDILQAAKKPEDEMISFLRTVFKIDPLIPHGKHNNETLLHVACRTGQLGVVRFLLNHCDASAATDAGSALHACARGMHDGKMAADAGCDVIGEIVASGCPLEAADGRGRTVFCYAAALGCLGVMKYLVARGCKISWSGVNALDLAALNGHLHVVDYLLSEPGFSVKNERRRSPVILTLMPTVIPAHSHKHPSTPLVTAQAVLRDLEVRAAIVERLLTAGDDVTSHRDPQLLRSIWPTSTLSKLRVASSHQITQGLDEDHAPWSLVEFIFSHLDASHNCMPLPDSCEVYRFDLLSREAMDHLKWVYAATFTQLLEYGGSGGTAQLSSSSSWRADHQQLRGEAEGIGEVVKQPVSLQKLCRTSIRVHTAMGPHGFLGLARLPVPPSIQLFLQFRNELKTDATDATDETDERDLGWLLANSNIMLSYALLQTSCSFARN